MNRILYISNIAGSKASINFFGTALEAAKKLNLDFFVVANRRSSTQAQIEADELAYGVHLLHADISRSPFSFSNYRAYKQIIEYIEKYKIDYIHCNTPVGGLIGRLAGNKAKVPCVLYQAHGFHFYKGAPLKNWLLYYPVERFLAHFTDALITINNEDFNLAKNLHLRKNGNLYYVPGVGIDLEKYKSSKFKRASKRHEMGVEAKVVIISMGDLIKRKNYKTAIKAISDCGCSNIEYWICGEGPLEQSLKNYANKLNVADKIRFLGFRSDIDELLSAADIFLLTSYQEGLPRSTSEAMASGLPCLVSNIRGNVDLLEDGKGGWLCNPHNSLEFAQRIKELSDSKDIRIQMSHANLSRIKCFDIPTVTNSIKSIYENEFFV